MRLMVRNSLRNIRLEQSENKKFKDYSEQIQGQFKALALWEKAFKQYF